jgi:hypothetical protein
MGELRGPPVTNRVRSVPVLPAAYGAAGASQDGQDEPDHDEDGADGHEDLEAGDQEAKNQQDDAEDDHVELLLFVLHNLPTRSYFHDKTHFDLRKRVSDVAQGAGCAARDR